METTWVTAEPCWGLREDSSSASQSQFRLSLAHPCPFKNSLSQLWPRLFVSQIRAMWEEQTVVPLWTGPSGNQDLLPAIGAPWSRKQAILVPTRPDPRMPAWRYGRERMRPLWHHSVMLPMPCLCYDQGHWMGGRNKVMWESGPCLSWLVWRTWSLHSLGALKKAPEKTPESSLDSK